MIEPGARVQFTGCLMGVLGGLAAGSVGVVARPAGATDQCFVDWPDNPHASGQPWCYGCLKRLDDPKAASMDELAEAIGWKLPKEVTADGCT